MVVVETWCAMARVQLHGLSRAELNGRIATVLPPEDEAEASRLAESGRVKVSNCPNALSLRPDNLAPAPPPDFATPPLPFTLLQIARKDASVAELCRAAAADGQALGMERVAGLDEPLGLAEALWKVYCDVPPAGALVDDVSHIVLDSAGHWLYWIGLEQVGHHIVIEACDGVWRGYQSCAWSVGSVSRGSKASPAKPFNSFGGVLVERISERRPVGYTARQWLSSSAAGSAPEKPLVGESPAAQSEIELLGLWCVSDGSHYEISQRPGGLYLRTVRANPFLVLEGVLREEHEWAVADVVDVQRPEAAPVGAVRLKLDDGELISNFMRHGAKMWGARETAQQTKRLEKALAIYRVQAAELDRLASEAQLQASAAAAAAADAAAAAEDRAKAAEVKAEAAFTRVARAEEQLTEASNALAAAADVAACSDELCAAPLAAEFAAAHKLWGGGRDLGRSEVAEVLQLVLDLRTQAAAIATSLREQATGPNVSDHEVAEWAQQLLEASSGGAGLSVVPSQPGSPRNGSGSAESDDVCIFSEAGAEPRCDLSVPSRLAFPFMRTFARLTGEFPGASAFLRILELAGWESLEREDGGSVGWTQRSVNLRNRPKQAGQSCQAEQAK